MENSISFQRFPKIILFHDQILPKSLKSLIKLGANLCMTGQDPYYKLLYFQITRIYHSNISDPIVNIIRVPLIEDRNQPYHTVPIHWRSFTSWINYPVGKDYILVSECSIRFSFVLIIVLCRQWTICPV